MKIPSLEMPPIKSIAIIGAGPAGAIAVDALAQEKEFTKIRVFERREKAGGCWYALPLSPTSASNHQPGYLTQKTTFKNFQILRR
jgi:cation diffusion facilitator CzcD-associated flavoprotein CzcO